MRLDLILLGFVLLVVFFFIESAFLFRVWHSESDLAGSLVARVSSAWSTCFRAN